MPGIGIGIGLPFRRNIATTPAVPSGLSASFTVDTISGDLTWTDNTGGEAQYEIYSSYNENPYVYLGTTLVGATSYSDTTCKQNASVVYKIRAKKGALYSDYATLTALATPLCLKTNQTPSKTDFILSLNIATGKSVLVTWGDGTTNIYTGNNTITKQYTNTGNYNISFSGDTNFITTFNHNSTLKTSGNITNWIMPSNIYFFRLSGCSTTGIADNLISPASCGINAGLDSLYTGNLPQIISSVGSMNYNYSGCYISGSNVTIFRKAMIIFNISNQKVAFSTANIDKVLKAAADWYQLNPPTANCTYNLSGDNMGIPTGGVSNVDIVRLIGYYSAAGFAATIICRTS